MNFIGADIDKNQLSDDNSEREKTILFLVLICCLSKCCQVSIIC